MKLFYTHYRDEESTTQEWDLDYDCLEKAAKDGGFYSYIAGTAAIVLKHPKYTQKMNQPDVVIAGLIIDNYKTTLPMKKGLSSSAAVCVLVATAFNLCFDLCFTQEELMEIAFQVQYTNKLTSCNQFKNISCGYSVLVFSSLAVLSIILFICFSGRDAYPLSMW